MMKNPFKEILQDEQLPELIKQKVVDDVALIKLSIDVADLFLVKHPQVISDSVKDNPSKSK